MRCFVSVRRAASFVALMAFHTMSVYAQTCAACHGPDGDKIAGKTLKTVRSRMSAEQLTAFILDPKPPMPKVFPEPRTADDERDVRDVAAFVATWPQ